MPSMDAVVALELFPFPVAIPWFSPEPPSSFVKRLDLCKMGSESDRWILGSDLIRLSTEAKT